MITVRVIGFVASLVPPGSGPAPADSSCRRTSPPPRTRSVSRREAARTSWRRRAGGPRNRTGHSDPAVSHLQLHRRDGPGHRAGTAQLSDGARGAIEIPGAEERDRCVGHALLRVHGATLVTAGLPTGCRYAAETFYGTMTTYTGLLHWDTATLCTSGGDSGNAGNPPRRARFRTPRPRRTPRCPATSDRSLLQARFVHGYVDRTLNPPVRSWRWSSAARPRRSISRTRRLRGVCSGHRRSMRRRRHFHLRFASEIRTRAVDAAASARADAHRLRARVRAVPLQPHVPRRGLRVSLRVVGARAGCRAARRAIRCRLGQSQLPVWRHRPVCDRARLRSSTSARRIATARCMRFSARASSPRTSRRRYRVTRRTRSC